MKLNEELSFNYYSVTRTTSCLCKGRKEIITVILWLNVGHNDTMTPTQSENQLSNIHLFDDMQV